MRIRRFTEPQIIEIIRDYDTGESLAELSQDHDVHVNAIRPWRRTYAGMDVADAGESLRPRTTRCTGLTPGWRSKLMRWRISSERTPFPSQRKRR